MLSKGHSSFEPVLNVSFNLSGQVVQFCEEYIGVHYSKCYLLATSTQPVRAVRSQDDRLINTVTNNASNLILMPGLEVPSLTDSDQKRHKIHV